MSLDNVHSVRLMTLESKPFQSRDFRLSQAKRTAKAFLIQIAVPNRFRRRTFHVLNCRYLVRLMKRSASELGPKDECVFGFNIFQPSKL